jgi:methionyl-tRNA formyltransferase
MGDGVVNIMVVGNVPPQSTAIIRELVPYNPFVVAEQRILWPAVVQMKPDLIIVAGWRHLIPPEVLAVAPTVGFHSARLPQYPGRAPVPWTLLRGDEFAYNTMLYLDEGVDSGDIIAERRLRLVDSDTPQTVYEWMAQSGVAMLRQHLTALLAGTAPRTPQNTAQRGPLTTKDGWDHYYLARQADGFG